MATSYPKAHTIRFTPKHAKNAEDRELYSLLISIVPTDAGPSMMVQQGAPMVILTPGETKDFVVWLSEQVVPEDMQRFLDAKIQEWAEEK